MKQETVVVGVLVRVLIGDCLDHGTLFIIAMADIAVAGLFLFQVAGAAVLAAVAAIFEVLAMLMNPHVALRAVEDGIR